MDSVSLTPGNNLTIIPFLYDMAGDMMNRSLMLQIKDSKDNIVYENIINSNSEFVLETKTNLTAGDLKITSQKDEVIAEKNINVLELKKINVRIVNQTIILENVGNVPYNQIMQFQIGNESVMKEVALSLNETKEYDVSAPDGTYDINIKDDSAEFFSGSGISMTGNVISIEEAGARITNFITEYPAVWIFLLLVVIGFFFSMFRRYQLTRFLGPFHEKKNLVRLEEKRGGMRLVVPKKEKLEEAEFTEKPSYKKIDSVKVKDIKTNESVEKINIHGGITKAEQAGVLHGQKQPVSVIALKIKSGKPTGMAKENIQKALEYAYDAKGASYISGDYILVLFSQIVTKNKNNEAIAIKAAQEMEKFLATHNRKFRDELEYGIGVNSGDLITKVENNTLKFVSIDKTLAIAKKIAEMSSGEVLLSKDIHLKTATTIKTEKIQTGDTEAFKIKRVVDTQASEKFIKDFLRRN